MVKFTSCENGLGVSVWPTLWRSSCFLREPQASAVGMIVCSKVSRSSNARQFYMEKALPFTWKTHCGLKFHFGQFEELEKRLMTMTSLQYFHILQAYIIAELYIFFFTLGASVLRESLIRTFKKERSHSEVKCSPKQNCFALEKFSQ